MPQKERKEKIIEQIWEKYKKDYNGYDYTGILKVYSPNKTRKIKVKYAKSKTKIKVRV